MNDTTIHDFNDARRKYLAKKQEIARMFLDLEDIKAEARFALDRTIDNGLSEVEVIDALHAYSISNFKSKTVQSLIDKVVKTCFNFISMDWMRSLEAVYLYAYVDDSRYYGDAFSHGNYVKGPLEVGFIDTATSRIFVLYVPIQHTVELDVNKWAECPTGVYKVEAPMNVKSAVFCARNGIDGPSKMICEAFDPTLVRKAVEKYLSGELDKDLVAIEFSSKDIYCTSGFGPLIVEECGEDGNVPSYYVGYDYDKMCHSIIGHQSWRFNSGIVFPKRIANCISDIDSIVS